MGMRNKERIKVLIEQGKKILKEKEGEYVNKGAFAAWRSNVYNFLNYEFSIEKALAFSNVCENDNHYQSVENGIYFLENLESE